MLFYGKSYIVGDKSFFREYLELYKQKYTKLISTGLIPEELSAPTSLHLELTYKCNQSCLHCYNQSGNEQRLEEELSLERWKQIARETGELGIFKISLSGGEPLLLGNKLFEIMDILNEYNIRLQLITNGVLVTQKILDNLKKYKVNFIQISIDGSRPELHNYLRGADSFEKAVFAANLIKTNGLPLMVSHVIAKPNLEFIDEMIDLAYYLGSDFIIIGPFFYSGRAITNKEKLELSEEEISFVYKKLQNKKKEYHGRMKIYPANEVSFLKLNTIESDLRLLIYPNGDVKINCELPFKIGNVKDKNIKEIWDTIGKNIWKKDSVIDYIWSLNFQEDLLKPSLRSNYDPDILIE